MSSTKATEATEATRATQETKATENQVIDSWNYVDSGKTVTLQSTLSLTKNYFTVDVTQTDPSPPSPPPPAPSPSPSILGRWCPRTSNRQSTASRSTASGSTASRRDSYRYVSRYEGLEKSGNSALVGHPHEYATYMRTDAEHVRQVFDPPDRSLRECLVQGWKWERHRKETDGSHDPTESLINQRSIRNLHKCTLELEKTIYRKLEERSGLTIETEESQATAFTEIATCMRVGHIPSTSETKA